MSTQRFSFGELGYVVGDRARGENTRAPGGQREWGAVGWLKEGLSHSFYGSMEIRDTVAVHPRTHLLAGTATQHVGRQLTAGTEGRTD